MNSRPLDAIFSPRSVAVVGASRKRDSIGYAIVRNLITNEFCGPIFPVNPNASSIHSLKCYPTIAAVPDPIDLAVVAVPKALALAAVDECLRVGVRGLVVITAGFGETGAEGKELEKQLLNKVRAGGARMIGPNCMGVINADAAISLNATFAPTPARRGSIGFVSQSGALGVAILNVAAALGLGLTQFVSMGNKADVSGNDLLEHWENDDATRVIAMYLESFGNPRRFTEIAKRVGKKKPILVVKSGRTSEGAQAASSHTGAIAGADVSVSAFLEQCGVLRADTIEELFDVARALDRCPLPGGSRVGIVTNAGGPAIMATDACVNLGLEMAPLSDATRAELASFLPPEASLANPIDMIASASESSYERALTALLADPGVDMVLAINVSPLQYRPADIMAAVTRVARAQSAPKPVLAVMMATEAFYDEMRLSADCPPVYRFPEAAARALAQLARYAEWRREPDEGPAAELPMADAEIARLLSTTGEGYLPQQDALGVLSLAGIPVVPHRFVRDAQGAAAAARHLGFPVVLKAEASGLVHKSDVGAVALGLEDEAAVHAEAEAMAARLAVAGYPLIGFMVQKQARIAGHEVIFGLTSDPRFGPLLMFGLGGKYVEVLRDVRFGVTPLSAREAEAMIRGIRGFQLLAGVRGERPADLAVLIEILLRLAQLGRRFPAIRELDVNPFIAAADGESALALDARIRVSHQPGGSSPSTTA